MVSTIGWMDACENAVADGGGWGVVIGALYVLPPPPQAYFGTEAGRCLGLLMKRGVGSNAGAAFDVFVAEGAGDGGGCGGAGGAGGR